MIVIRLYLEWFLDYRLPAGKHDYHPDAVRRHKGGRIVIVMSLVTPVYHIRTTLDNKEAAADELLLTFDWLENTSPPR